MTQNDRHGVRLSFATLLKLLALKLPTWRTIPSGKVDVNEIFKDLVHLYQACKTCIFWDSVHLYQVWKTCIFFRFDKKKLHQLLKWVRNSHMFGISDFSMFRQRFGTSVPNMQVWRFWYTCTNMDFWGFGTLVPSLWNMHFGGFGTLVPSLKIMHFLRFGTLVPSLKIMHFLRFGTLVPSLKIMHFLRFGTLVPDLILNKFFKFRKYENSESRLEAVTTRFKEIFANFKTLVKMSGTKKRQYLGK